MAGSRLNPKRRNASKSSPPTRITGKKVRRKLKWGPVFWLLWTVEMVIGLMWSPVTSPDVIYVRGCRKFDEDRVRRQVQCIKGYPFSKVPIKKVESLIMKHPSVKGCGFKINILGKGSLNLQQREPVARLEGYKNLYVDREGTIFALPIYDDTLPFIKLNPDLKTKVFTMSGIWESGRSANLCVELKKWFSKYPFNIEVDSRGLILLDLHEITKIFLGSYEKMDEKFDVLSRWLEKDKETLKKYKMFNLSVPKYPTYIP